MYFRLCLGDFTPKPIYLGFLMIFHPWGSDQKPQINWLRGEISKIALTREKVLTTRTPMQNFRYLACLVWNIKGMGSKRGLAFTKRRKPVCNKESDDFFNSCFSLL